MWGEYFLLCGTALLAGVCNAVAGGGTLLTFPALQFALGMSAEAAVIANATSTVALVPGSIASAWGYRREVARILRWLLILSIPSLAGGYLGARLVVLAEPQVFKALVPWLILGATVLFASQPKFAKWLRIGKHHQSPSPWAMAAIVGFQFLVSVYGGYFGAAAGILMLAALALMGFDNIHEMNALKSSLGTLINIVAVGVFAEGGKVHWPYAVAMAISAAVGGFLGASFARRLDKHLVARIVVAIGFTLATIYFYRQFFAG